MMKNKKSGFTLVEVLTVIMIIAILATVVLVSLDAARKRARDSTIQNQLSQIRSLAETVYSIEEGYEDFTNENHQNWSDYRRGVEKINEVSEGLAEGEDNINIHFSDNDREYCAYSSLVRNPDEVFCIDSSGNAVTAEDVLCDSENFSCEEGEENGNDNEGF